MRLRRSGTEEPQDKRGASSLTEPADLEGDGERADITSERHAATDRSGRAPSPDWRRPLLDRPVVRSGVYAWAIVGLLVLAYAVLVGAGRVSIVVIPLVLALFPAALLAGPASRLKRVMPDALAAFVVLIGFLVTLGGALGLLAPQVAAEVGGIAEEAQRGAREVQQFLEDGPLGFQPIRVDALIEQLQTRVQDTEGLGTAALGAAAAVAEGVAGFFFLLVVLFFYLKDGPAIARWLRDLFPERVRDDAAEIGGATWNTVGGYIRGQLIIALVDAVLIGIAIAVLGVPLALPLAVLVFIGGLFPIVGAVLSGLIAVLVALATTGLVPALILLAVIVAVQQIEGDVLAPLVLGRAVQLHPLAVLAALAAGGVLLGVLGAFLAVPVAASAARAAHYLRERVPG